LHDCQREFYLIDTGYYKHKNDQANWWLAEMLWKPIARLAIGVSNSAN
jgi:hypothetical protein